MEGLLILIGIWALDFIVKKVAENKKRQQELQQQQNRREEYRDDSTDFDDSEEPDYNEPEAKPSRSLQDLIRQFENAQREAEQGNIEPPVPPVSTRNLPSYNTRPATLHEIAEVVIDYESINLDFLVETFFIDYDQAKKRLAELQEYRIVGRDMGEGDCDVLVHDMDELENLFSRAQRQAQEQEEAERIRKENEAQLQAEREKMEAHRQELERQRKLNELENRAKSARESAAAFLGQDPAEAEGETRVNRRAPAVSTRNIADVRKGFIWAKVLDEPRFKRRWSAQYR